jgi:hypothetical protein
MGEPEDHDRIYPLDPHRDLDRHETERRAGFLSERRRTLAVARYANAQTGLGGFAMDNGSKISFKQGSKVWVWDSMWLPAVVVQRAQMDRVLVRVEHGLTFTATMVNLLPRDPAGQQARPPSLRQPVHPNGAATVIQRL